MTKDELIEYSAEEVRRDSSLYTEFLRIYQEEGNRSCTSCNFKYVFSQWQRSSNPQKFTKMNTFTLKNPNLRYRVNEDEILSKDATDEVALKYLALTSYKGGKTKKENLESIFKVLPKGYGEEETKKATKKATEKTQDQYIV